MKFKKKAKSNKKKHQWTIIEEENQNEISKNQGVKNLVCVMLEWSLKKKNWTQIERSGGPKSYSPKRQRFNSK